MRAISQFFRLVAPLGILCVLSAEADLKKIGAAEAIEAVISKTHPEYPALARQLKIEGKVELEAVIAESGQVEKVNIVSGNPILTKPAADALKRWKFKPFLVDGKPARVLAPITMGFKL